MSVFGAVMQIFGITTPPQSSAFGVFPRRRLSLVDNDHVSDRFCFLVLK
jgi:hypothetical protein